MTLGITNFHGVTGGVYKARERIHRCVADQRLLAIPTSRGRVAAHDPNWDRVCGFAPMRARESLYGLPFVSAIVARVWPRTFGA